MQRRLFWNIATAMVALALLLPGCNKKPKKAKVEDTEAAPRARNEAPAGGLLPKNLNPGIAKNLPSVGRINPANDLSQFAVMYMAEGKAPQRLEDMPGLSRDMPSFAQAIRDGIYVVNWGARPGIDNSQAILAYVRDAATQGGVVVLLDGSVHNYSAQQFQDSPKIMAARQRPANERK